MSVSEESVEQTGMGQELLYTSESQEALRCAATAAAAAYAAAQEVKAWYAFRA